MKFLSIFVVFILSVSCTVNSKTCTTDSNGDENCTETTVDVEVNESSSPVSGDSSLNAPTDISLSASNVTETDAANTVVGTLTATDPNEGDTFTFVLASGDGDEANSLFNIEGNSLRLTDGIEFDDGATRSIRVRVTDAEENTFEKNLSISVTEVSTDLTLALSFAQSFSGIYTTVEWDTVSSDVRGAYGTGNYRVNITEDGYYLVSCSLSYSVASDDGVSVQILDDDGQVRARQTKMSGGRAASQLTTLLKFSKGDWFVVQVAQDSGGGEDIDGDTSLVSLEMSKISTSVGARVSLVNDATITSGAQTIMVWDNEVEDLSEMHDNVTDNTQIKIPAGESGWYVVGLNIEWEGSTTAGTRALMIGRNGDTILARSQIKPSSINQFTEIITFVQLSAGDFIEALVQHATGSDEDIMATSLSNFYAYKIKSTSEGQAIMSHFSPATVTNGSQVAVRWTSEQVDDFNGHDDALFPERFNITEDGRYILHANVIWTFDFTGSTYRRGYFRLNGTTNVSFQEDLGFGTNTTHISKVMNLSSGDYVELLVNQNSGSTLNLADSVFGAYGTMNNQFMLLKLD